MQIPNIPREEFLPLLPLIARNSTVFGLIIVSSSSFFSFYSTTVLLQPGFIFYSAVELVVCAYSNLH